METNVIKIGNSKGVRLSKTILEKYQIGEKVEIILEDDQIVLKPIRIPRQGWAEAFKKMHEEEEDKLLIPDVFEDEDFEEWK
jgi:antitoxin MazE